MVDNTTNYMLTQTETRGYKVAVEGEQGSGCSRRTGCSPVLTSYPQTPAERALLLL